ncbi:hypothetical protein QQL38_23790 [Pseudomonas syringae]
MRREATIVTKSQVMQWLQEVLETGDLDGSMENLTGRTIGSLCVQKIMVKIDAGTYRLSDLED